MFLRLAFSVAINVDPDILLVDEALAVGDALFQKRCHQRLAQMRESGLTLLLVSHDHEMIRNLTSRALLLDSGNVLAFGETREVSRSYRKQVFEGEAILLSGTESGRLPTPSQATPNPTTEKSYGVGGAQVVGVAILDTEGASRDSFKVGEVLRVELSVQIQAPMDRLNFGIVIRTLEGLKVYSWGTFNEDISIWAGRSEGDPVWSRSFRSGDEIRITLQLEGNLGAGHYEVQAVVSRELQKTYGAQQILHWRDEAAFFRVEMLPTAYMFGGICDLHGRVVRLDRAEDPCGSRH